MPSLSDIFKTAHAKGWQTVLSSDWDYRGMPLMGQRGTNVWVAGGIEHRSLRAVAKYRVTIPLDQWPGPMSDTAIHFAVIAARQEVAARLLAEMWAGYSIGTVRVDSSPEFVIDVSAAGVTLDYSIYIAASLTAPLPEPAPVVVRRVG